MWVMTLGGAKCCFCGTLGYTDYLTCSILRLVCDVTQPFTCDAIPVMCDANTISIRLFSSLHY